MDIDWSHELAARLLEPAPRADAVLALPCAPAEGPFADSLYTHRNGAT